MEQENQLETAAIQEKKRRKRRKVIRTLITILFILFMLLVILAGIVAVMRAVGGRSLRSKAAGAKPELVQEEAEEPTTEGQNEAQPVWEEGWIRYEDKIYEYNEDILTFLVMGIDKKGTVKESQDAVSGGQADALFLVVLNPEKKDISLIAVNRDTMTEVNLYGYTGEKESQMIIAQIAVQHGYGGGMEESCELTRDAVSNLFYGLPIHGYISMNMGAITKLNDALGGIEVTIPDGMTKYKSDWTEGKQVKLKGTDAFYFVKWRDTTVFESNRGRLARQKQYLGAFAKKAKEETKKDITLPITLYNTLSPYIVTDITLDEMTYLAGELIDYQFSENAIYTLEGTTQMGQKYEEFYPDEKALKDLMIRTFYKEVEPD